MNDRPPRSASADDEALSALIDGALTTQDAQRLRERIAGEPVLAARLTALEQADAILRNSYAGIVEEPLPPQLLARLKPSAPAENVVALHGNGGWRRAWVPSALAAGIALAVGLVIGLSVDSTTNSLRRLDFAAGGTVAAGSGLFDVLESVPSGQTRVLDGVLSATPRFTFRTVDGDYCRQLGVSAGTRRTETLACRQEGIWQLEMAVFGSESATPASADVYRPAGRDSGPMDSAVNAMIEGSPLGLALEERVMAAGWIDAAQR
jgi:hypothetical protein